MSGVCGVKSGICALSVAESAQAVAIVTRTFIRSSNSSSSSSSGRQRPLIQIKKWSCRGRYVSLLDASGRADPTHVRSVSKSFEFGETKPGSTTRQTHLLFVDICRPDV
jgi:hypothetical protein